METKGNGVSAFFTDFKSFCMIPMKNSIPGKTDKFPRKTLVSKSFS